MNISFSEEWQKTETRPCLLDPLFMALKMLSFRRICTLDWISGCTLCNMAGVTEAQESVTRRRRSCNVGGWVAYTCPLCVPTESSMGSSQVGARGHSAITISDYLILKCPMENFLNV
ncbi:hypothetical protein AVEN_65787-1 [Araneus ventricosus]|uniref:Uncharacterized protein n=1 Tax=Araneus ventricosus TaxID=182803 RepID=A0A4Y2UFD7_ARAVE|nr:hypothetical protein AVEN_65787-1 [Araneus ventricosus]